ncbi:MAG: thiamine phosphate synthase [Planctomycetota bacterium]|jgi:thiamine-phosphate pyrophosphorylase|nr:thiamine phosphate synthase [Planctomycetota bacterium]
MSDDRLGALRLVFITPGRMSPDQTLSLIGQVLEGGVTTILLREPQLSAEQLAVLAEKTVEACQAWRARTIISRDVDLAHACGADGVHLGWDSPSVDEVRKKMPGGLVGRSAHWPIQEDDRLADYVTLSPFRATWESRPRPLLEADQIHSALSFGGLGPVIALGGLTAGDVPDLPNGLSGVAAVRALADATDPRGAAAVFRSALDAYLDFGNDAEASHGIR